MHFSTVPTLILALAAGALTSPIAQQDLEAGLSQAEISPRASAAPRNICNYNYTFGKAYATYDIKGANLNAKLIGPEGQGLKREINYCGAVTKWKWESNPADGYDWEASGRIIIGQSGCVAGVVLAMGGVPHGGNCYE